MPCWWWIKLFHVCYERKYYPIGNISVEIYSLVQLPNNKNMFESPNIVYEVFEVIKNEYEDMWRIKIQQLQIKAKTGNK